MRWNLVVATLAASWGLIAVIVRKVDLDAQVLVFYRLAFAAVTLGIAALVLRKVALLRLSRHRGRIVVIGDHARRAYPAEVDAVLLEHPAVGDVAVIGVPSEEWGEEVKAVVEPHVDIEPSDDLAQELIGFCRSRLAHFKCPRSVDFVEQLPRLDNGKIYKRRLRELYR